MMFKLIKMFILIQKKHCSMCVFNKEQMFQLLSESESRLIERMDVGSGNHESQVIINQIKVHSNALKMEISSLR